MREQAYRWIKANPNTTYKEYNDYSYYYQGRGVKKAFYKNIEESILNNNENPLPFLYKGKLALSGTDKDYVKLKQEKDFLILETIILDEWHTLYFPIPDYMTGKIQEISKPTIEIVNGKLAFGYSVKTNEPIKKPDNNKWLSVDLGMREAFAAIVMNNDNKVSDPLVSSRYVSDRLEQLKTYDQFVKNLNRKLKRHEQQKIVKQTKITEKERLISARRRQKKDLHYLIAKDVIAHALEHNCSTIVIEDLKWAKNWRFAKALLAIKHVAQRHGIHVKEVNPAKSSQTCPECTAENVDHPIYEITTCTKCGWKGDRDYAAAIVLAKTAKNKKAKKLTLPKKPRSRRPSVKTRKKLAKLNNHQRTRTVRAGTLTTPTNVGPGDNKQQKPLSTPIRE